MADNDVALDDVRAWLMTVQDRPAPTLDLDELLLAGRRHRRRRHTREALTAIALAAAVTVGTFVAFGGLPVTDRDVTHPGPTPSVTRTTSTAEPGQVPGYSYEPATLAQLDGFDLQRSVTANETVTGGIDISAAAINQVFKDGRPEHILLLQYEFRWPVWSSRGIDSDIASEMTTMPISEGFAKSTRVVALQTVRIAGTRASHFEAGAIFYAWTDRRGVVLVSGTDRATTRAFVSAYIRAERHRH